APEVDVFERLEPFLRRLQHRRGRVHRNHVRDKRRDRLARAAGAAAEIADGPGVLSERGQRGEVKAIAEELVAQPNPLTGRRSEEFLRLAAPLRQRGLKSPLV